LESHGVFAQSDFGGHFMPESNALQKVRRNSRLR
jgi:hypothetical protein